LHIPLALGDAKLREIASSCIRMWRAVEDGVVVRNPCLIKGASAGRPAERLVATIGQVFERDRPDRRDQFVWSGRPLLCDAHRPVAASVKRAVVSNAVLAAGVWEFSSSTQAQVKALAIMRIDDLRIQRTRIAGVHVAVGGATVAAAWATWKTARAAAAAMDHGVVWS